jgi:hypothetical protein
VLDESIGADDTDADETFRTKDVRETFPLRVGSVGLELMMFCATSNTS